MAERQLKIDVIVEADGSITKIRTLDDLMSRLSDRTLAKVSAGIITADDALKDLQRTADKTADTMARHDAATTKSAASTQSFASTVQKLAGIVGVTLTANALVGAVKTTLQYADAIDTSAQRAGIGVEAYQKMAFAAKQNNVEIGQLTSAINMLQDRIAGHDKSAVSAMSMLGLSFETMRRLKPEDQILAISDAIKGVTDHNDQIHILNDLFGKQGKELLPLIAGNMREVMDAAHIMSAGTVKDLADTNDALDDIKNSLTSILGQLLSMTGVTWVIKVAAQDLRGPINPANYFGQLGNTISQLTGIGLYGMTAGQVGNAGWDPLQYQRAGGGNTRGKGWIDLPNDQVGAGIPGSWIEDTPWGPDGEVPMGNTRAGKSTRLRGSQFPWVYYGTPGDVSGRMGAYDYSFWNTRTTTNTDFFGPGSSLSDMAMKFGMMGGPSNVTGRGPFSTDPRTQAPGFLSTLFGGNFGSGLTQTMLGALMGGGSVLKSTGSFVGSSIGGAFAGMKGVGSFLSDTFGKTIGSALGGAIPFVGSLLGPLLGKLFGPSKGKVEGMQADSQIGDLQKGLTDLYGSFQNVDELGKLVGVDIGSAWGDKNVNGLKHFTQATKDFNAALEQTNQKFQALIQSGGLADQQTLAIVAAQAKAGGQVGDNARQMLGQFLQANVNQVNTGLGQIASSHLPINAQGASAIGSAIQAQIAQMQSMGMSMSDILTQLGPTITALQKQFHDLGVDGGAAFDDLNAQIEFLSDKAVADAISGIDGLTKVLVGLQNTGNLTQETFEGLAQQIDVAYQKLIDQGKDGQRALRAIAPDLQKLWELEQKFGYKVDDATQALIDQGLQQGLIGPQFQSDADKMTQAIDKLIERFGQLIDKILGIVPAANTAGDAINNMPPPPGSGGSTDPQGPVGHGGGLPHVGERPPGYPPDQQWPPPGTQIWTGGYITPYGVQHLSLGGMVWQPRGTDTVPAMLTPGELVIDRATVNANGGPGAITSALRGRASGSAPTVNITIQAYDGADVMRMVNSPAFGKAIARRLPYLVSDNIEGLRTHGRKALGVTN